MKKIVPIAVLLLLAAVASADTKLSMSKDIIHLHEGDPIEGTLVCAGDKTVVVLVDDESITIDAADVALIERGEATGEVREFTTTVTKGEEKITGEAQAEEEVVEGAAEEQPEEVVEEPRPGRRRERPGRRPRPKTDEERSEVAEEKEPERPTSAKKDSEIMSKAIKALREGKSLEDIRKEFLGDK